MPLLNIRHQALIFSLYGAILAVNHILSIWYKIPDSDLGQRSNLELLASLWA